MPQSPLSHVGGVLVASNFAFGVNPAIPAAEVVNSPGASGAQTLQLFYPNVVLADGRTLNPFATTAPLTFDIGANAETVTPSAVSVVTGGPAGLTVNITATFANVHGQGCRVSSGTAGLQEAINYANASLGGGVVVVDGSWTQVGGTEAILEAATLGSSSIRDNRGPSGFITKLTGATDAIPLTGGTVIVATAGVDAMTLATPTAGTNDGLRLTVISAGAHAHTITTAADKINGGDDTATFAAAAGNSITLVAYQGIWYAENLTGVTLSEV